MIVSLNWIKDFVDVPNMSPKELGSLFTLATAEVEDVIVKGEGLRPILCVEIKSLKPHPEADKLNLVTFDVGEGVLKEVVCGAPNVRIGLKVPYAPMGTTLPNGMTLEPKKIRGILSDGMLCSETELGLGESKAGLMELNSDVAPGTPLVKYLNLETDILFDIDNKSLTHRPDLWGHLGMAREFAALHKKDLLNPYHEEWHKKIEGLIPSSVSPLTLEVEESSACLAYYGLCVDKIKMSATPSWMKNRLESVGLRSINLIVDISNYVMVELGMPNHIFDRDKIVGDKIIIKRAASEIIFTTLDEIKREILPSDTLISDKEKPLVLAGLMGGAASSVTEETSKLFLEVANWEAPEVRKTSTRLGLRTDSSQRFEKTLDGNLCYRSLLRMVELIKQLCPEAEIVGKVEKYVNESKLARPLKLSISYQQIVSSLGMEIPQERIVDIFTRLDFKVNVENSVFEVIVPSYRTTKDISCKADLIEEIGRMIGYDNITPVSPLSKVRPVRLSHAKIFHRKIQDFMVFQAKALQVMTYPLTGPELIKRAMWPVTNEHLVLVNSISVEHDRMRPSIIPSALEITSHNQKYYDSFSFFELGRSYVDFEKERSQLVIGLYAKEATRFLELVNIVEKLMATLNLAANLGPKNDKFANPVISSQWAGIHPHEYLNVQIMGKYCGALTSVHPMMLKNFKMKGHLALAVIDLTDLEEREIKDKTKYTPLSKFPSSSFDFTVVINSQDPAATVLNALNSLKQKELKSKTILDVFQINEAQKAVTVRTVFADPEKTLGPEAIKDLERKTLQVLEKAGLTLRG